MSDVLEPLVADLVEWVAGGRSYVDVMEAWKTSCPRLPVWEEANRRGLLVCTRDANGVRWVSLTPEGKELLHARRTPRAS